MSNAFSLFTDHRFSCILTSTFRDIVDFTKIIEVWYADHARTLPWRETSDPYRIWISEIILQQTRVAQGYDYYQRFIERFPTVEALAFAAPDEVMQQWEGLGYYSRARNLHAAAQQIVAAGEFPRYYEGVRALKGVGDYTAAAICSFAFGLPYAVIDGNVYRVLSRYFGIDTPIDSTVGKKEFAALADTLLDSESPALYNQAIMDFGALQCLPRSPHCAECPLADSCVAWAEGRVASLPVKVKRTAVKDRYFSYLIILDECKVFIHRRPAGDIWTGLYEPLLVETSGKAALADVLPAGYRVLQSVEHLKHQLTHRTIYADAHLVSKEDDAPSIVLPEDYISVEVNRLSEYAAPRLVNIIYGRLFHT